MTECWNIRGLSGLGVAVAVAGLLITIPGCHGLAAVDVRTQQGSLESQADNPAPPPLSSLETMLYGELAERGIDPARAVAEAPSQGSEVFDLEANLLDPDGSGPLAPTGYRLTWTERLVGDYDENSEVNVGDLSALALNWQKAVQYDDARLHTGFKSYPVGDPEFAGDIDPSDPPIEGSGAYNWRLARVDGDGNGDINISDITPIAVHFMQRLDGYHVYRRRAGETQFVRLEDPPGSGTPLVVTRADANGGSGIDNRRPVLYEFTDEFEVDGQYEYRVVPYDTNSDTEGPPSLPGFNEPANVEAQLVADVTQGPPPLTVQFDASASTSLTGEIVDYAWDLDGDGILEEFTGNDPHISRSYMVSGPWLASVEVTNADGDSDVASVLISVTKPPTPVLHVDPEWLEVPVLADFDASASFDTDGEVVGYEWDLDDDGEFELDTGPVSSRQIEVDSPGTMTIGVRVRDNTGARTATTTTAEFGDDYDEREDNDTYDTATGLGLLSLGNSVSELRGGMGSTLYDGDDHDWFSFELAGGAAVSVDLEFMQSAANLELGLYGPDTDTLIAASTSQTDNESLAAPVLVAGTYYILVSRAIGPGSGSALYSLSLNVDELVYDEVEDNDSAGTAQDLGNIDSGLLPQFVGNLGPGGYDGDEEDWYAFSIGNAAAYRINLQFFHAAGDLDLQLYSGDGQTLLGSSLSVGDNETIVTDLEPGDYLVRCFWSEVGNANYILSILYM